METEKWLKAANSPYMMGKYGMIMDFKPLNSIIKPD